MKIAKVLAEKLIKKFGDEIEAIVLYGSVARKETGLESDIDLLIIVPEGEDIREQILSLTYDVDLEFGAVTSQVYMTPQEFERYLSWGDPFLENVLKEGVIIYDRGFYAKVRGSFLKKGK